MPKHNANSHALIIHLGLYNLDDEFIMLTAYGHCLHSEGYMLLIAIGVHSFLVFKNLGESDPDHDPKNFGESV